jgi:hypothetical protein
VIGADAAMLRGSVDGRKFGVERPTVKARYSRKYFGRGKGVVAYTLLCNDVPLQGWRIGAHESLKPIICSTSGIAIRRTSCRP